MDANLEMLEKEGCADVFGFAKQLLHARPHTVDTLEQYQFMYDVLVEWIECKVESPTLPFPAGSLLLPFNESAPLPGCPNPLGDAPREVLPLQDQEEPGGAGVPGPARIQRSLAHPSSVTSHALIPPCAALVPADAAREDRGLRGRAPAGEPGQEPGRHGRAP